MVKNINLTDIAKMFSKAVVPNLYTEQQYIKMPVSPQACQDCMC